MIKLHIHRWSVIASNIKWRLDECKRYANAKLKEFDEKINDFIKNFESTSYDHHCIEHFLKKYSYMKTDEIRKLFDLCLEIENTGI